MVELRFRIFHQNHPLLMDEYELSGWEDITGQAVTQILPEPNEYTIAIEAEESVIAAIEDDSDYTVLWSESIDEGPV